MNETPTYFRAISAISPGSLAAVYQAIRAHEDKVATVREASASHSEDKTASVGSRDASILSGVGIPAAMSAYGEAIATAGE